MELFTTKQITWQNMVFTVLLSTIGSAVQLNQMKNAAINNTTKGADNIPDDARRAELKKILQSGERIPPSSDIHIPKGSMAAPSAKFAGTKEAYIDMLYDYAEDIAFVNKYIKNKEIMAKFLNQIGNEGMDFIGIEHPFIIDNAMLDRGATAFDGTSVVEINTRRLGLWDEFENDLAEMARRVFHEKRHVYQNIQRSLGFGHSFAENSMEPLRLYASDWSESTRNSGMHSSTEYYDFFKGNQYDYKVAQDGRFPRNITNQDIDYGMQVSHNQANYVSSGPKYGTQFVEVDAEDIGKLCGNVVEDITSKVELDVSKISKAAKAAYLAEKYGVDFDDIIHKPSSTIDEAFLAEFQ